MTMDVEKGTRKLFWFQCRTKEGTVFAERDNDSITLKLRGHDPKKNDPRRFTRDEAIEFAKELMRLAAPTYDELSEAERASGKWEEIEVKD
jgi:hypothetical protein